MAGAGNRMNKLRRLFNLKYGPGAAILPRNVTKLHFTFAYTLAGHMGPRKFVREQLPRLKFWNPSIPMIVNRAAKPRKSASLRVYTTNPAARIESGRSAQSASSQSTTAESSRRLIFSSYSDSSPYPEPSPNEKVTEIDMLNKRNDDILQELLNMTNAQVVSPTPGEVQEMENLRELEHIGARDREIMKMKLDKDKEEAEIRAKLAAQVAESASAT